MHPFIHVFSKIIPAYGLCIVTGAVLSSGIAALRLKKLGMDVYDFLVGEGYGLLGAMIGSKLLYLIISIKNIDFSRITDPEYLTLWMSGGFVFYGGLLGAFLAVLLCKKIHHIDVMKYLKKLAFLIPFAHGFGRIGCHMAGCCYGIPYHGFGAIVFPEGAFGAPAGVELFPVQLTEACLLFLLSGFLFWWAVKKPESVNGLYLYLILYGIIRFFMEMLRYDLEDRGGLIIVFSISQWISVLLIAAGVFGIWRDVKTKKMA